MHDLGLLYPELYTFDYELIKQYFSGGSVLFLGLWSDEGDYLSQLPNHFKIKSIDPGECNFPKGIEHEVLPIREIDFKAHQEDYQNLFLHGLGEMIGGEPSVMIVNELADRFVGFESIFVARPFDPEAYDYVPGLNPVEICWFHDLELLEAFEKEGYNTILYQNKQRFDSFSYINDDGMSYSTFGNFRIPFFLVATKNEITDDLKLIDLSEKRLKLILEELSVSRNDLTIDQLREHNFNYLKNKIFT